MMGDMDEALVRALEPVLRDITSTGAPRPRIGDGNWQVGPEYPCAMLLSHDGSGMGVSVYLGERESLRIVGAADNVQGWVIDELWTKSQTNWPVCPRHPATHPLAPAEIGGLAAWVCPIDRTVVSQIGSL